MRLTKRTKHIIEVSVADIKAAKELIDAIEGAENDYKVVKNWEDQSASASTYMPVITISVEDNTMMKLKFSAYAKQNDGTEKAAFERILTVYRDNSPIQLVGPDWVDVFTLETNYDFDIGFQAIGDKVMFSVKNATDNLTTWSGSLTYQEV